MECKSAYFTIFASSDFNFYTLLDRYSEITGNLRIAQQKALLELEPPNRCCLKSLEHQWL
jgi:hypothetical protein